MDARITFYIGISIAGLLASCLLSAGLLLWRVEQLSRRRHLERLALASRGIFHHDVPPGEEGVPYMERSLAVPSTNGTPSLVPAPPPPDRWAFFLDGLLLEVGQTDRIKAVLFFSALSPCLIVIFIMAPHTGEA